MNFLDFENFFAFDQTSRVKQFFTEGRLNGALSPNSLGTKIERGKLTKIDYGETTPFSPGIKVSN
jgi:hypothetical protein